MTLDPIKKSFIKKIYFTFSFNDPVQDLNSVSTYQCM